MRYHVFESCDNGYMPDNAASYETLQEARDHVAEWVEGWRDFLAQGEAVAVVGEGDYTLNTNDLDYAEIACVIGAYRNCYIETCNDPACELCAEAYADEQG